MLSLETPFPIQLKGTNNLYVKLASLVRKVEYLKLKKIHVVSEQRKGNCVVCESKEHRKTKCYIIPIFKEMLYGQTF